MRRTQSSCHSVGMQCPTCQWYPVASVLLVFLLYTTSAIRVINHVSLLFQKHPPPPTSVSHMSDIQEKFLNDCKEIMGLKVELSSRLDSDPPETGKID